MKKLLISLFVLLVFIGTVSASGNSTEQVNQLSVLKTGFISNFIIKSLNGSAKGTFLGDSITAGGGTSDPTTYGFSYQVSNKLKNDYGIGITMDNSGHGGYKVSRILNEVVPAEILPFNYDLIVVGLGTNDWNYSTSLTQFENDYRSLIDTLISKTNADILCVGIGWFDSWASPTNNPISEIEYNKIIEKICAEYKIGYVDVRSAMINSGVPFDDMTYAPDRVHPNDTGATIWANEVYSWFDFQGFMIETEMERFTINRQWATDAGITYTGTWIDSGPYASTFGRKIKQSSTTGSTASYQFTGDRLKLYFVRDRDNGKVKISLDGNVLYEAFDCYSANFVFTPLNINTKYGEHELKIEVLSSKNASSSGRRIALSVIDNYVPM